VTESDAYNAYLDKIMDLYPELYFKLMELPDSSIRGTVNDMVTSKINLDNPVAVQQFMKFRLNLAKYISL